MSVTNERKKEKEGAQDSYVPRRGSGGKKRGASK